MRGLGSFAGLFLLVTSAHIQAASPLQIHWHDLSFVVGKDVSLVMPGGAFIRGKAVRVDGGAMTVNVVKTSDPGAYRKGEVRVPRESLRILVVRTKGRKYRVIGTALGAIAGFVGGLGAAWGITGGLFGDGSEAAALAALIGITAGGTVGGYVLGKAADERSTTYEILP